MSDVFTIMMFVTVMGGFFILLYRSGVIAVHLKGTEGYPRKRENDILLESSFNDIQDAASDIDRPWRRTTEEDSRFLYGCQGIKQRRRYSTQGID